MPKLKAKTRDPIGTFTSVNLFVVSQGLPPRRASRAKARMFYRSISGRLEISTGGIVFSRRELPQALERSQEEGTTPENSTRPELGIIYLGQRAKAASPDKSTSRDNKKYLKRQKPKGKQRSFLSISFRQSSQRKEVWRWWRIPGSFQLLPSSAK